MRRAAVVLALSWGMPSSVGALEPAMDFAARVQRADRVVLAEPTSMECRYAVGQDWLLETEVWLAPIDSWKGPLPEELSLVLPGGQLGELGVKVEDVPVLPLDQPVVLLLAQTPAGWVVVGGELGAVAVRHQGRGEGRPAELVHRAVDKALR